MNIFIFDNLNLNSGVFIHDDLIKKINFDELTSPENILFVLPNEIFQYIEFKHDLKNNQNIHASILNNLSTLNIDSEDLLVLNTSQKFNFFTLNKTNQEQINSVFKNFNSTIHVTSDLLFFKEVFKQNCTYLKNVYLIDTEEAVKLTMKSFDLLDDTNTLKSISNSDLKGIEEVNFTSYQLNTFSISSIFNLKKSMKPMLLGLFVIFSFYLAAFLNINSNYSQMNEISTTLESIYSEIYPSEDITDIHQQIDLKHNNLKNEGLSDLSKTIDLIKNLSESIDIIQAEYTKDFLQIKCVFKNDAEESIFINQQNRLNYNFKVINSSSTDFGKITTLSYEL